MLDHAEQLQLEASVDGAVATLHAAGELDIYTASQLLALTEQLCSSSIGEIVLDGGQLQFVDSAGLRALVLAHDRAEMQGVELWVTAPSDALGKVLSMTGLDEVLTR